MSGIWGRIDFNLKQHQLTLNTLREKMEEPYHSYKIDTFGEYFDNGIYFGYGGQFFTEESKFEKQPIYLESKKKIFVADVVLDNRNELLRLLKIEELKWSTYADADIVFKCILKFGLESYKLFSGTYTFVYYDLSSKTVYLVADKVGSRVLYYSFSDNVLLFSTLLEPLKRVMRNTITNNKRYIADFLALDSYVLFTNCEETIYDNIFKVAPGSYISVCEDKLVKNNYWFPNEHIFSQKLSDERYKQMFVPLFDASVYSTLRSLNNTGILLSGGLDSTSVACFAASALKKKDKMLYSFTSIPEKEDVEQHNSYYILDERPYVEKISEFLGNLRCSFINLPNENGWDGADEIMKRLEIPYKSLQNIKWIRASLNEAYKKDCRIVLTGQYGNTTISYGDFETDFNTLFFSGKWLELIHEINAYNNIYHYGRKRIYLDLIKIFGLSLKKKLNKQNASFEQVYVNRSLINKYEINKRFIKNHNNTDTARNLTLQQYRPYMYYKNALSQIGEFETKLSLDTGVLMRDPTRNPELIEFCMNLPNETFVYRGKNRRLVREYLKEYLPQIIIEDYRHKGLQSADTLERMSKHWTRIYSEVKEVVTTSSAKQFLDVDKILSDMEQYKEIPSEEEQFQVMKILYSALIIKVFTTI